METLIAIGHIVGSLVAVIILGIATMFLAAWEVKRNEKHLLEETSIHLGVPVEDLDKEELTPRIIRLASERYSSELFRNRLSDLCGVIRIGWGCLGLLIQVSILIGVAWYTFTDGPETAIYAWVIVGVWFLFWIVSVAFSLVCRLLTGRYPGQAKQARKAIASVVRNRRTA